jgi:hypothetical protein
MEQSPFSEAKSSESSQEIPRVMDPEDTFPHSHAIAICPYTKQYQAIPCLPIPFLENQF